MLSQVQLYAIPWTVGHQAPLSMEFSKQEYWSGLPFPTPGGPPDPGIKPEYLASPALAGGFFTNCAKFIASRMVKNKFAVYKPPSLWYFLIAAWTD